MFEGRLGRLFEARGLLDHDCRVPVGNRARAESLECGWQLRAEDGGVADQAFCRPLRHVERARDIRAKGALGKRQGFSGAGLSRANLSRASLSSGGLTSANPRRARRDTRLRLPSRQIDGHGSSRLKPVDQAIKADDDAQHVIRFVGANERANERAKRLTRLEHRNVCHVPSRHEASDIKGSYPQEMAPPSKLFSNFFRRAGVQPVTPTRAPRSTRPARRATQPRDLAPGRPGPALHPLGSARRR